MLSTATNPYATQSVQTASPAKLVTMLYDRLLTALSRAVRSAQDGASGYGVINAELQRAQDILSELRHSLNHEDGKDIAASLDSLYGFCIDRVVTANTSKDMSELGAVKTIITEVRDAWVQSCDPASTAQGEVS